MLGSKFDRQIIKKKNQIFDHPIFKKNKSGRQILSYNFIFFFEKLS
jgi:hypothetical protein